MNDLVSVVIITYNRHVLLERAIRSVIAQDYKKIELIVVDDCSEDSTATVIKNIQDECNERFVNFLYLRNKVNQGSNYSRNKGYQHSSGKYVTGLDDDDYFLPNRISALYFRYEEKYAFVCDRHVYVDEINKKHKGSDKKIISLQDILKRNVIGNQVMTTRDKLMSVGCFSPDVKRLQDMDVWIKLILKYGEGIKYNFSTYIVDDTHLNSRITTSVNEYKSYRKIYFKYRKYMDEFTKSYNLVRVFELKGMSYRRILFLLSKRSKERQLKYKLFRRALKELVGLN